MFAPVDFFNGFSDLISYVRSCFADDTAKPQEPPVNQSPSARNADKGEPIKLTKRENMTLDAEWCTAGSENGPTAILFHGSGDTLEAMRGHATWYRTHGINTLLVTIEGYPGDEKDSGEIGLYLDVETAIHYVTHTKNVPNELIIAHGYSLGGTLAAAAGKFFGTYVTLDHPIDPVEKKTRIGTVYATNNMRFTTDGLNTLDKMKACTQELFIFCDPDDPFTVTLYETKYGKAPSEAYLEARRSYLQSKESHIAMTSDIKHTGASEKYAHYLYSIGLMDSKYL